MRIVLTERWEYREGFYLGRGWEHLGVVLVTEEAAMLERTVVDCKHDCLCVFDTYGESRDSKVGRG